MAKLIAAQPFHLALNAAEAAKSGLATPQDGDIFPFVAGQDIPDALVDHWYVKALMADGIVTSTTASDPEPVAPTKDELIAKATELGLKVDGRWGEDKLIAAIAEAEGALKSTG